MADRGTATLQALPDIIAMIADTYAPAMGATIDVATLFTFGGGGTPVAPKRYLNVGGTAVPIQ